MTTTWRWRFGQQLLALLVGVIFVASCSDSDSGATDPDPKQASDTTPPTVALTLSDTLVTADGDVTLSATASDNKGVTMVDFYDGATKIGSAAASPFQLVVSYTESDNGLHHHWAAAKDAAGNSADSDTLGMIVAINVQTDFINGGFDTDAAGWNLYNCEGFMADGGNPGGFVRLNEAGHCSYNPTAEQLVTDLIPGLTYTISGDYRTFVDWIGNPAAKSFVVTVDSVLVGSWARSPAGVNWYPFDVDFVATQSSHTIGFHAEWECDDSSYDVDNLEMNVKLP